MEDNWSAIVYNCGSDMGVESDIVTGEVRRAFTDMGKAVCSYHRK